MSGMSYQTSAVVGPRAIELLPLAHANLPDIERTALHDELLDGVARGRGELVVLEIVAGESRNGWMALWILPGGSATTWPPTFAFGDAQAAIKGLRHGLDRELCKRGVRHAQALLPLNSDEPAEALAGLGFGWMADMLYLVWQSGEIPKQAAPSPLQFVPNAAQDVGQLAILVDATYEGTLDCPALNGLRTTKEVLVGYTATGHHRPEWWYLITVQDRPIGCLLLADYPQASQVELMYFGLSPAARGKGYSEQIVRFAQRVVDSAHRDRLVLAVDARNYPAIQAYLRCGFVEWDRRAVWLKPLQLSFDA